MSNRQFPSEPQLGRAPRPPGVVHSASHGMTVFGTPESFKILKVKACKAWRECGIKSPKKVPHFHPGVS